MRSLLKAFIRHWKLKCFLKRAVMVAVDDVTVIADGKSVLEGYELRELQK